MFRSGSQFGAKTIVFSSSRLGTHLSNHRMDERSSQLCPARDNMLTKYQMIKFIDFCEVWFLPESVARVAAIVGDHHCHTPRH
ncbi:hypothetical protein TNCV_3502221 [Trichonephila clavipes]|uniref:Uncharacterized protein n=1 Tax=Trichonephila clavipes TaxID=2585209 RepID=A0A8X6S0J8_TRICX|nr:hypothetical protein TNCV_3502221 [Trichonephila clavipes]